MDLVRKKDVDDFLEVLRWSKESGADTTEGRQTKQGTYDVLVDKLSTRKRSVRLNKNVTISLASSATRMNIQLSKATDFSKLRGRGCTKIVTIQRICARALQNAQGDVRVRIFCDFVRPFAPIIQG